MRVIDRGGELMEAFVSTWREVERQRANFFITGGVEGRKEETCITEGMLKMLGAAEPAAS